MAHTTYHKNPTRYTVFGLFRYSRWTTADRTCAVVKSVWLGQAHMAPVWHAVARDDDGLWTIQLGCHRTRKAAERTVNKYIKQRKGSR